MRNFWPSRIICCCFSVAIFGLGISEWSNAEESEQIGGLVNQAQQNSALGRLGRLGHGQDLIELMVATKLVCEFEPGVSWQWEKDQPTFVKAEFASSKSQRRMRIEDINFKSKMANLVGNAGQIGVTAELTENGLRFLEQTNTSAQNSIVVFPSKLESGQFKGVYNRSSFSWGNAIPSQFTGKCEITKQRLGDEAKEKNSSGGCCSEQGGVKYAKDGRAVCSFNGKVLCYDNKPSTSCECPN